MTILCLSIYSTAMSGLWLVVAFYQPRYGHGISSQVRAGVLAPSTASLLSTLVAKTIEMSFVTVFVAFVGQVVTRRSFMKRSRGVTLAEMTMRNWVIVGQQTVRCLPCMLTESIATRLPAYLLGRHSMVCTSTLNLMAA